MKKLSFIALLTTVILVGCTGATGGNTDLSPDPNLEMASAGDSEIVEGSGKPIHLDKESFKKMVMDYEANPKQWVYEGEKPCVIDFYADWCKPCRMIAPIMEELAKEYEGQITIYKVDTQVERELASVFGITSLPTVVFVPATGSPSAQKGALPKESYKQIIDEFLLQNK
jgi:thioredoxin